MNLEALGTEASYSKLVHINLQCILSITLFFHILLFNLNCYYSLLVLFSVYRPNRMHIIVCVFGTPVSCAKNLGPDLHNILRQSYDYLPIMPKLQSTYDGRLIYKTSYEGYDSLAKL